MRVAPWLMLGVGLLAVSGCSSRQDGPRRFQLSGKVTFGGKPVALGRISFEPDRAAGNTGPGGYGSISAGRYTTHPTMGAVGGPHTVHINGFDGIPVGEVFEGKPLFPEYTTTVDLPAKAANIDFDVPASAAQPLKAPEQKSPPKR